MPSLAVHYDSLKCVGRTNRGPNFGHWNSDPRTVFSGCMPRMAIVVMGSLWYWERIVPNTTGCGNSRFLEWELPPISISTGAGIPMSGYLRVLGINGCTLYIYGANVQVYVNGTIRRDWFKDDIDTGNRFAFSLVVDRRDKEDRTF